MKKHPASTRMLSRRSCNARGTRNPSFLGVAPPKWRRVRDLNPSTAYHRNTISSQAVPRLPMTSKIALRDKG